MKIETHLHQGKTYRVCNGTYYNKDTPDELIRIIEALRADQTRVAIYHGNTKTGQLWDTTGPPDKGRIGRSIGPVKVPLLIHNRRCLGGEALLDSCILKITATVKPYHVYYIKS